MSHVITCGCDSQTMIRWAKGPANFFFHTISRNFLYWGILIKQNYLFCHITSLVEVGRWLSKWIFMPATQLYSRAFKEDNNQTETLEPKYFMEQDLSCYPSIYSYFSNKSMHRKHGSETKQVTTKLFWNKRIHFDFATLQCVWYNFLWFRINSVFHFFCFFFRIGL